MYNTLKKKKYNKQRTVSGKVTSKNLDVNTSDISLKQKVFPRNNTYKQAIDVKTLNQVNNPQVTNVQNKSIQVGTSETIRSLLEEDWYEWLAGLIDGDGYFALSKKGYASLEITMDMKDAKCLYQVKQHFGGSIKRRSGVKAMRYRLHDYKGLIFAIERLNGRIRNPIRQLQLAKICDKYSIKFIFPKLLKKETGWLAGFFDSDGTITINKTNLQLSI